MDLEIDLCHVELSRILRLLHTVSNTAPDLEIRVCALPLAVSTITADGHSPALPPWRFELSRTQVECEDAVRNAATVGEGLEPGPERRNGGRSSWAEQAQEPLKRKRRLGNL